MCRVEYVLKCHFMLHTNYFLTRKVYKADYIGITATFRACYADIFTAECVTTT